MLKKNFLESSAGSAPLELAGLVALLVLPLTPMLFFYQAVFDAIAAESIARHSLRAAILQGSLEDLDEQLAERVATLAESWEKEATFRFECGECKKGDLISLEIQVGNTIAIQVAGLEPR